MEKLNQIQMQVDELHRASDASSRFLKEILARNIAPGIVSEQIGLAIISRDVVIGGHCTTIQQYSAGSFAQLKTTYTERERAYAEYDHQAESLARGFDAAAARGESENQYRRELNHARENVNADDGNPGYRPSYDEVHGRHGGSRPHAHGTIHACGSGCSSSTITYEVSGDLEQAVADYLYIPARMWVAEPPKRLPFIVPPDASIIILTQVPAEDETFLRIWAEYEDGSWDDLLQGYAAQGGNMGSVVWTNRSPFNATIRATANRGTDYSSRPQDSIELSGSKFLEEVGFFSFGFRPPPNEAAGMGASPDDAVVLVARTDGNDDEVTTPLPGEAKFEKFVTATAGTQLFSFAALGNSIRLQAQETAGGQTFPPFADADWVASPLYSEEREWTNTADLGELQLAGTELGQHQSLTWRKVDINAFTIAGAGFIPGDIAERNHPLSVVALAQACPACDAPRSFAHRPRASTGRRSFRNPVHIWMKRAKHRRYNSHPRLHRST